MITFTYLFSLNSTNMYKSSIEYVYRMSRLMNRAKKTITLPPDIVAWAKEAIEKSKYPGVRSFSALIEYLLRVEMSKRVN